MPTERLLMRKAREILRLAYEVGLSKRKIGQSLGIGASTAQDCLHRARRAGLAWPLPLDLDDAGLEARLFPPPPSVADHQRPKPDWAHVHRELFKADVSLGLLWEEYRAQHPAGFGYSWYCEQYREWLGRIKPRMRQTHVAGDKLFVDFAGRTMPVTLSPTGEIRAAQVFVAVLGASNYTYAEAVWSQTVPDWVGAHVRAFQFFGGATRLVVPDNLKSAVIKACYFEPQVQRTYGDMLRHYGSAALPARPLKPRDKAKVEVGVQIVQRWILARLRNRIFISLPQLNAAILELVGELNNRLMRHLGVSRRQLFDQIEAGALKKLPDQYYVYADWQRGRVGLDYHVRVDQHAYSVPSGLIGEEVDARISAATVEIFHRSKRVAVHLRTTGPGATTAIEHMPASHRRYKEWSVERIQREAAAIGSSTATLIGAILNDKPHPELGFRAALGILRLAISHGQDRLEAACVRALAIGARSYTSVASILTKHLERHPDPIRETEATIDHHANVRGSHYYH